MATKTKTKSMDDAGKTAVVTGATLGLGRAAAQALAKQGFVTVGTGEVEQGGFYHEGKLRKAPRQAEDPAFAASLRSMLEGLVS